MNINALLKTMEIVVAMRVTAKTAKTLVPNQLNLSPWKSPTGYLMV